MIIYAVALLALTLHLLAQRLAARVVGLPMGLLFAKPGGSLHRRALVAASGALLLYLSAASLAFTSGYLWGVPAKDVVVVMSVTPGSPADGILQPGDSLLVVDGVAVDPDLRGARSFTSLVQGAAGANQMVTIGRGAEIFDVALSGRWDESQLAYRVGISINRGVERAPRPIGSTIGYAAAMPAATAVEIAHAYARASSC